MDINTKPPRNPHKNVGLMDDGFYCIKTARRSYTGVLPAQPTEPLRHIDPERIRERLEAYWA